MPGLDARGLQATVGPATITLGGLLKHLAGWRTTGSPTGCTAGTRTRCGPRWTESRPGLAVALGRPRPPEQLFALWEDAMTRSRALTEEALADGRLTGSPRRLVGRTYPGLRWIWSA